MKFLLLLPLTVIVLACNSECREKQTNKKTIENNQFFKDKKWNLRYYSFFKKANGDDYDFLYKKKVEFNTFTIRFESNFTYIINNKLIGKWDSQNRRLELIPDKPSFISSDHKDIPFSHEGVYIIDFAFKNRLRLSHFILDKNKKVSSYFIYEFYEKRDDLPKNIDIEL